MAIDFTQANRLLSVTTPLPADTFLLERLSGSEAVSGLYEFELHLLAPAAIRIRFEELLGRPAVAMLAGAGAGEPRYFHGIINRLTRDESVPARGGAALLTRYIAHLVPGLWLLTKRRGSRIWNNTAVPDILHQLLGEFRPVSALQGEFKPRNYVVQYDETDFAFVSRLMEEEGISYHFKHTKDAHQLVLTNGMTAFADVPAPAAVRFAPTAAEAHLAGKVTAWRKTQEVSAGLFTVWDSNPEKFRTRFEAARTVVSAVRVGSVDHPLGLADPTRQEIFEYPARFAHRVDTIDVGGGYRGDRLGQLFQENDRVAGLRMEREASAALRARGQSRCPQFTAGHAFALEGHGEDDGKYLLLSVTHEASLAGAYLTGQEPRLSYHNEFAGFPVQAQLTYRPPAATPRPVIPGTQTAVVVGPTADEVPATDRYGRVKVQFHWDRQGTYDLNSSCWVRVSQFWAGKGWGAFFWPRVGNEVVVAFENGDPERPIIVGSVYNSDNPSPLEQPPFGLPAFAHFDGVRSKTLYSSSGTDFNGILFADSPGNESLTVRGSKDVYLSCQDNLLFDVGKHAHSIQNLTRIEMVGSLLPGGNGAGGGDQPASPPTSPPVSPPTSPSTSPSASPRSGSPGASLPPAGGTSPSVQPFPGRPRETLDPAAEATGVEFGVLPWEQLRPGVTARGPVGGPLYLVSDLGGAWGFLGWANRVTPEPVRPLVPAGWGASGWGATGRHVAPAESAGTPVAAWAYANWYGGTPAEFGGTLFDTPTARVVPGPVPTASPPTSPPPTSPPPTSPPPTSPPPTSPPPTSPPPTSPPPPPPPPPPVSFLGQTTTQKSADANEYALTFDNNVNWTWTNKQTGEAVSFGPTLAFKMTYGVDGKAFFGWSPAFSLGSSWKCNVNPIGLLREIDVGLGGVEEAVSFANFLFGFLGGDIGFTVGANTKLSYGPSLTIARGTDIKAVHLNPAKDKDPTSDQLKYKALDTAAMVLAGLSGCTSAAAILTWGAGNPNDLTAGSARQIAAATLSAVSGALSVALIGVEGAATTMREAAAYAAVAEKKAKAAADAVATKEKSDRLAILKAGLLDTKSSLTNLLSRTITSATMAGTPVSTPDDPVALQVTDSAWGVMSRQVRLVSLGSKAPLVSVQALTTGLGAGSGVVSIVGDGGVEIKGGPTGISLDNAAGSNGNIHLGSQAMGTGKLLLEHTLNTVTLDTTGVSIETKAGAVTVKGSMITLESPIKITLKVGETELTISPLGITLKGLMIDLKADLDLTMDAPNLAQKGKIPIQLN